LSKKSSSQSAHSNVYILTRVSCPVIDRFRRSFYVTLQSNIRACWCTDQLVWDLDKWMNWKKKITYLLVHFLQYLTQREELMF